MLLVILDHFGIAEQIEWIRVRPAPGSAHHWLISGEPKLPTLTNWLRCNSQPFAGLLVPPKKEP